MLGDRGGRRRGGSGTGMGQDLFWTIKCTSTPTSTCTSTSRPLAHPRPSSSLFLTLYDHPLNLDAQDWHVHARTNAALSDHADLICPSSQPGHFDYHSTQTREGTTGNEERIVVMGEAKRDREPWMRLILYRRLTLPPTQLYARLALSSRVQ
jgi:hypothetical protein